MTPEQRSLRSRLAAHCLHAKYDSRDLTAAARSTFLQRFEDEVDPQGVLPPEERARRAEHAKKACFTRLSMQSAKARAARKNGSTP